MKLVPSAAPARVSTLLLAATAGLGGLLVAGGSALAAAAPTFTVSAAPTSLPSHNDAGEPSIGVNWSTGAVMFQAYTATYRITPPGTAWTDASSPFSQFNIDPILWTDSAHGRTLAGGLDGTCSILSASDDDGGTWIPTTNSCSGGGWDHETVGGGPYSTGGVTPPHTFDDAVYYCSQSGLTPGPAWCARSDNGGLSFGAGTAPWTTQCGGLHGHVKVGPNGYVYVPNADCGGRAGMAVSKDNGVTWSVVNAPAGPTEVESDPSVAVDRANTAYECWQEDLPRADKKVDAGSTAKMASYNPATNTWGRVTDLGALVGAKNIQFPAAVAGDSGKAACAFLGTPTGGDDQNAKFAGVWHLYVVTTYDGGASYVATDVTGSDPVQKGCIWLAGGSNDCRNLLDFMDAQIDATGHIVVGFADGCTAACASGGAANYSAWASLAYQTGGDPLLGGAVVSPSPSPSPTSSTAMAPLAPAGLTVSAGKPGTLTLQWSPPSSDGGAAITGYEIYRGTAPGNETKLASVGNVTTYRDAAAGSGQTRVYYIRAVNSVGAGAPSQEASGTAK